MSFSSVLITIIVSLATSVATFLVQERKLRTELRTEFMAETAVKHLLNSTRWKKRSFEEINKRVRGFADDDLRKILVRAGAVSFTGQDGKELWGLIDRNKDDL